MSATTCAVAASVTEVAVSRPDRLPAITATSASTVPVTDPPSARMSFLATTSPLMEPLICSSPSLTTSPSILTSTLRIEGVAERPEWLRRVSTLVPSDRLNNIFTRLQKLFRILDLAVDRDLIVEMRSRASARAAEFADLEMRRHLLTARHRDAVKVAVPSDDAMTMVDLDELTVGRFRTGKRHDARGGAVDRAPIGRDEIEARMKGLAAREGIGAAAECAFDLEAVEGRAERQGGDDLLQLFGALSVGRRRRLVERHIRSAL